MSKFTEYEETMIALQCTQITLTSNMMFLVAADRITEEAMKALIKVSESADKITKEALKGIA